jgi:hypothetical protein
MIRDLVRRGYPSEYLRAVDIVPNNMANDRAARLFIAPAVDSLLRGALEAARRGSYAGAEPSKVDIVAHSMGAVSSRWYAVRIAPERVRTWISIAGSNHGTDALCPYPTPGSDDMCPAFATEVAQSAIQIVLNGVPGGGVDETPYGVGPDPAGVDRVPPDTARRILYFTIRIDPDGWIRPARSAVLSGAGGVAVSLPSPHFRETTSGNFLFIGSAGHDPLPGTSEVIELVAQLLSAL